MTNVTHTDHFVPHTEGAQEMRPRSQVSSRELLREKAKTGAIVLHSLPRMDELPADVDQTRHARYWQEAFKLPAFTPARVRAWFHLYGEEAMAEASRSLELDALELEAKPLGKDSVKAVVRGVTEPLQDPRLARLVVALRAYRRVDAVVPEVGARVRR